MYMRYLLAFASGIVVQFVAVAALAQAPQPTSSAKRLVGTWRLVSVTESRRQESRGEKPTGLIYYDDKGNMAVQIMPDRPRTKFAGASPTPDEARDAILGYTAYFGTYTVDEMQQTVTHKRTGNIDPSGLGDYVRRYEFLSDDRIILRPLETKGGLTWERVK